MCIFRQGCALHLQMLQAKATATATAKAGIPWVGGAAWTGRTRRKPIHGGSMAASMPPTVLPAHAAPPLTGFRDLMDPRHAWMNLHRNRIFRIEIEKHPRMAWIYCVDQGRHLPTAVHAVPTDRGKLSKAGWVRWRERERHVPEACLGRVGQDAQPRSCRVRRTAHTSKRRPSLHGRTCSVLRNRTHPAIPQETSFCCCCCCCCCSSS